LYYIITTFKDQSSINQHSKSATNFEIFYDVLQKIGLKISNFSAKNKSFKEQYYNYSSIDILSKMNNVDIRLYDFFNEYEDLLNDIEFLIKYIEHTNFEQFHSDFLKNELKKTILNYWQEASCIHFIIQKTLNEIKLNLQILVTNSFVPTINGNKLLRILLSMQPKLNKLVELGYLQLTDESAIYLEWKKI
jgi:tRNA nucleotidyltransferase/poly(A) polymerase